MAAKLLHSLTDDNPDLQKQIGCMTGIFQLFDRHHVITGRRITGHSPKRLPAGSSHINSGSLEMESNSMYPRPTTMEKHTNKIKHEKQLVPTESSRTSLSSSSHSSSFSSIDCNRTAQQEALSFDQIIFPETPSRDHVVNQSSASPTFGRHTIDLRDVVKDSMYREIRSLSVKNTSKDEAFDRVAKHKNSSRPQVSKTSDWPYSSGLNGKQSLPVDLKESIRVLAKLREAPWYFSEAKELSRSTSYGSKDGSLFASTKDAPRFSYDGREINRLSFESRDTSKYTNPKLKDLPRLSLDSREDSMRSFNSDFLTRNSCEVSSCDKISGLQQSSELQTRPPSVVAKLMGLDALPESASTNKSKIGSFNSCSIEDSNRFSGSSRPVDQCKPVQISSPLRNSWKEPVSPRWKNPDFVMKPISRCPIEAAPWRQPDGTKCSHKVTSRPQKAPEKAPSPFPSVYNEIEKRLKALEFTQSGKDLRALKQILEAMQEKGLLDTQIEGQETNFSTQRDREKKHVNPIESTRFVNQRKTHNSLVPGNKGITLSRTFESPIVVMKPAKLVESGDHALVIPFDGLSGPLKFHGEDVSDSRKSTAGSRTAKTPSPKTTRRDNAFDANDVKTSGRNLKLAQTSTRLQQLPKESSTSSVKSSGSISPRVQQKKHEPEKRSKPPTPPSDSTKSRRPSNKQQSESSSPGGRRRPKCLNQLSDDQSTEMSSDTRNHNYQLSENSLQSDGTMHSDLKVDAEVTSSERSVESNSYQSPPMQPARKYPVSGLKSTPRLNEDESLVELASVAPEYPSPVSVLDDGVLYADDSPSLAKQIPNDREDPGAQNLNSYSSKEDWTPADGLSADMESALTSEINRKKLQNIEHLVQKLRRLNSSHDETRTDYIASLCENSNPDYRYVSEILLASGLLLRDLGSSLTTFQFHPSGHPINPELFLVLEQTKASTLAKKDCSGRKIVHSKHDKEKCRRRLIFDAVNEILVRKLAIVVPSSEPWTRPHKLARKTLNAQKLLRELCLEIEQLQAMEPECSLEQEEDGLKSVLWEDVMYRSDSWTNFSSEIPGAVLDVERLLFKDLVDEIVMGEATGLRPRPGRRCKQQLFKK